MKRIIEVIIKNPDRFTKEIHYLNAIAQAALDHQMTMTQDIFGYCLDFYINLDEHRKREALMNEYPELLKVYVNQMEKEVSQIELPEETPEQADASWQTLCARIRAMFGEDAI